MGVRGGLAVHWQAHGLQYGISAEIDRSLREGSSVIFNASRGVVSVVRAPQFADLSRLEQHRLVKGAVQERMDDGSIHALSVKTIAVDAEGMSGGGDAGGSEAVTSEMDAQSPPQQED